MKKNYISALVKGGWICGCIACMISCGPVHRFTRIKNVPREYMRNYSVEGVKVPRSQTLFRHTPWIVFAREAGTTYLSPSGKNEMQAVEYMDAFLVIKRKGDWLRLIRYDPAILKNGRLKEWKQAKYCGWINQNDLLLTRSGFTDVVTGFKNKQVVMLTDTLAFADPDAYFANDSVKLFKNPDLTQEAGKIPFYGIVYPYQTVADKGCVLVANKPQLDADSIGQTAIGWMDGRLLTAPEQQLHIDIASLPDSTLVFKDRERKDTLHLSSDEMRQKLQFADNQPTIRYSPVLSYRHNDTAFCFRTHVPMPVIDKRESYVLNVNGHPIYYGTFKHKIEEDLRKINLMFVLEGKESTIQRFPAVVNAIQGLQSQLANDESFSFKFGAVLTFNEPDNREDPICKLTPDYMELLDFLSAKARNADHHARAHRFGRGHVVVVAAGRDAHGLSHVAVAPAFVCGEGRNGADHQRAQQHHQRCEFLHRFHGNFTSFFRQPFRCGILSSFLPWAFSRAFRSIRRRTSTPASLKHTPGSARAAA